MSILAGRYRLECYGRNGERIETHYCDGTYDSVGRAQASIKVVMELDTTLPLIAEVRLIDSERKGGI